MATIDYKEKYEQALEKSKEIIKDYESRNLNDIAIYAKEDLTSIFPELRESEDERIKEAIIATIHLYYGEPLEDEAKEMLAWLEKQGEQKQELLTKDMALKNSPYVEQKPAWSEKYIAEVFEKVGLAKIAREQSNDNLTEALQSAMIELSKFTPQPRQEWSEEDEENFARVDYACLKVYGGDSYSSDWLRKFLGIHKKWKPSDEQMKQLGWIAEQNKDNMIGKELMTLYNDLKKL